ncbi:unnamed protein product, partial [Iphiclides podalirius]
MSTIITIYFFTFDIPGGVWAATKAQGQGPRPEAGIGMDLRRGGDETRASAGSSRVSLHLIRPRTSKKEKAVLHATSLVVHRTCRDVEVPRGTRQTRRGMH